MRTIWPILGACLFALNASALCAEAQDHKVTVDLSANDSAIRPGRAFTVALHFKITPGWHVYWRNPGDAGSPPKVKWTLPEGSSAGDLQFPVPKRIDVGGGLTAFGYEDDVAFMATITPSPSATGVFSISVRVSWVVCKDICIADHQTVTLDLPVGRGRPANTTDFIRWVSRQPLREQDTDGRQVTVENLGDPRNAELQFVLRDGEKPVDFFPPNADFATFGQPDIRTTSAGRIYRVPVTLLPGLKSDFTGKAVVVVDTESGKRVAYELPCAFRFSQ